MFLAVVLAGTASPAHTATAWPERVLVTNDNGIHDPKIRALANAFATHSDTWLVAPATNRSGSSNLVSVKPEHLALTAVRLEKSERLTVYSVAGYPADCVALGLNGLLRDSPPDLVVSGINGGPNLGLRDWFGSGTIGAARLAALAGIPAIAVSGLNGDDTGMLNKVVNWVVAFAHSPIVRNLKPGEYLTIAIPTVAANEIRGIRIAAHTPFVPGLFAFDRVAQANHDGKLAEVWAVKGTGKHATPLPESDAALYRDGYIVITPMRVGEDDAAAIPVLRREAGTVPRWPATLDRPGAP
jgi:5'-nucleotidase